MAVGTDEGVLLLQEEGGGPCHTSAVDHARHTTPLLTPASASYVDAIAPHVMWSTMMEEIASPLVAFLHPSLPVPGRHIKDELVSMTAHEMKMFISRVCAARALHAVSHACSLPWSEWLPQLYRPQLYRQPLVNPIHMTPRMAEVYMQVELMDITLHTSVPLDTMWTEWLDAILWLHISGVQRRGSRTCRHMNDRLMHIALETYARHSHGGRAAATHILLQQMWPEMPCNPTRVDVHHWRTFVRHAAESHTYSGAPVVFA